MEKLNIQIGFKYSMRCKNYQGEDYWKPFQVIGFRYGHISGEGCSAWKTEEEVFKKDQFIQVVNLYYLGNLDMIYYGWKLKSELENDIQEDTKLLPQFRKFRIDN